MDASSALTRLGGLGRRQELLRLIDRAVLESALETGAVVRVARGRYALPDVHEARVAAARVGGTVSHLSAAMACGWKVKKPPRDAHVTVPRNSRAVAGTGVTLHYTLLDPAEVVDERTSAVRTVVDCARTLPFDEALAVADSALRSRTVTRSVLVEAARQSPRTGRRRALQVVEAASGKAANPFESVLRAIALGVPGFEAVPQGPVDSVGHADVADLHQRIALEAESWEYHGVREAFEYDIRRYTEMVRRGWLVLRFTWDEVMHKPRYVRAAIADLVAIRAQEQEVGLLRP